MKINPHLQQLHSSKYLSQLNGYKGIFQILTQQFSTVQKALKLASRAQELAPSGIMLVILKPKKHLQQGKQYFPNFLGAKESGHAPKII